MTISHPNLRSTLEPAGPWTHRHITAGGSAFHVADTGPNDQGESIVLLHDFPLFWWSWRDVLPLLAAEGYRVIALDQRGAGTSDLQRDEPDLIQLAFDVTAVVSTLGINGFTVVGSGMGGAIAWMLGAQNPVTLRSIITIAAPHPLEHALPHRACSLQRKHLLQFRTDFFPPSPRRLRDGRTIESLFNHWSAPYNTKKLLATTPTYQLAVSRPFAAPALLAAYRAARHPNRASRRALSMPVIVPTLALQCALDKSLPASAFSKDVRHTQGLFTQEVLHDCGHFASEENPHATAHAISRHVSSIS